MGESAQSTRELGRLCIDLLGVEPSRVVGGKISLWYTRLLVT